MKILITGNLGYVGSVLTKYLKKKYPCIIIRGYDIGYFKDQLSISNGDSEIKVDHQHIGDIRSFDENLLDDTDAIIHLAAISNDPIGKRFAKITEEVNYHASLKLAMAAKKHGVKSFSFASSCSVYGLSNGKSKCENDILNPLTEYAKSKINTEMDLKEIADKNFTVTALRFSTACGSSDRLRLDLVLNDFVASAMLNNKIEILSDGTPWRPLIDVEDMARAFDWAIHRDINNGGQFLAVNVGRNENNVQIIELAKMVSDYFTINIQVNSDALPDNRSYKVDFSLFNNLAINYLPIKSIRDSIKELAANMEMIDFKDKNFRNSDFIRLLKLNKLIQEKRLNRNLEWIIQNISQ